ncbi:MAG: DUF5763 domain-containing protein [Chitinophagaceae bacterium]
MKKAPLIVLLLVMLTTSVGASAQEVYKTPSGEKYHLASCRMVKNVSEKLTLAKALELQLGPCKICHPPTVGNAVPASTKKVAGVDATVQCKGFTKAGTRCKHMTSIANGYCFQHHPG